MGEHEVKADQSRDATSPSPSEKQGSEPMTQDRAGIARVAPEDNVHTLPRVHRPKRFSAMPIASKQRCLVCNAYGCEPIFVTRADAGGEATGDNLLPVCKLHSTIPLILLYKEYPQIHRWLHDQERLDVILELRRQLKKYRLTVAW